MKTKILQKSLAIMAGASLALMASNAIAQDSTSAPQLAYGVPQVMQLAQAKVGDDTIIAYIKNSGNSYGLNADQIIYLRQQGVSDAVITTMLKQPKPTVAAAANPTPASQSVVSTATSAEQVSTATVAPAVTYVQTVPTTTYYYSEPYYYPAYGYYGGWYPGVSVSFGFGGRFGGGFRGGGFHGGGFGGGFHGHR